MGDSPLCLRMVWPLAVGICLLIPASAPAQLVLSDKVTLKTGSGGSTVVRCEVVDYTGEGIQIRSNSGMLAKTYPAEDVISVETPQTQGHVSGQALFVEGKYAEAITALEGGLLKENREWVRRDILALLVRCALQLGDLEAAGTHFAKLGHSDPRTHHMRYIPLDWGTHQITPRLRELSANWLDDTAEPVRLVGASLLLFSPDGQQERLAKMHLRRLQTSLDPRVNALAVSQYWRTQISPDFLDESTLKHWEELVEKTPAEVRGGPMYMLGQAYAFRRENEQAAAAMLWIPLVYEDDRLFASHAMLEAADALRMHRSDTAALSLYREITQRYAGTQAAKLAQDVLNQSRPQPGP